MDTLDKLELSKDRVDRRFGQFQSAYAALFRDDGAPKYGDEEHAERVAALMKDFEEAVEVTIERTDAGQQEVQQLRDSANLDPSAGLTPEELQAANSRALFVREDCEDMSLHDLARRVRVVALSDDRVTQFLFHRYASRRTETIRQAVAGGTVHLSAEDQTALGQLSEDLGALGEKLRDPAEVKKLARADALKQAAFETDRHARRKLIEAREIITGRPAHYTPRI